MPVLAREDLAGLQLARAESAVVTYPCNMSAVLFQLELVSAHASGPLALEQQTADLARELREVRGITVDRVQTDAPEEAKGLDWAEIGSLLGSIGGPAGAAIGALVGVLHSWIGREEGRKIRVKIGDRELELTGAGKDERRELIALFTRSVENG